MTLTTNSTAVETNPISEGYFDQPTGGTISLAELAKRGGKVTRVRMLTEWTPATGRVADISYIHGEIEGVRYDLRLDIGNLIPLNKVKGELIEWAKRQGVFAKGVGLLDSGLWSSLR